MKTTTAPPNVQSVENAIKVFLADKPIKDWRELNQSFFTTARRITPEAILEEEQDVVPLIEGVAAIYETCGGQLCFWCFLFEDPAVCEWFRSKVPAVGA